jgi:hypothetical protein
LAGRSRRGRVVVAVEEEEVLYRDLDMRQAMSLTI